MNLKKIVAILAVSLVSAPGMAAITAPVSHMYSENGDYQAVVVPYVPTSEIAGTASYTVSENGNYQAEPAF